MAQATCLARLGLFKVSHISGTSTNGNAYDFYVLERSYQNTNKEWQSEKITLRPTEMLAVSAMLEQAGKKIMQVQATAQNAKAQQSGGTSEPTISDDVPF